MGWRPRFKQVEVAKYLGIGDLAVSKVFLAVSEKSGNSWHGT